MFAKLNDSQDLFIKIVGLFLWGLDFKRIHKNLRNLKNFQNHLFQTFASP